MNKKYDWASDGWMDAMIHCERRKSKTAFLRAIGISMSTYYRRIAHPETSTLAEIRHLIKVDGWSDEQILVFIKGER